MTRKQAESAYHALFKCDYKAVVTKELEHGTSLMACRDLAKGA